MAYPTGTLLSRNDPYDVVEDPTDTNPDLSPYNEIRVIGISEVTGLAGKKDESWTGAQVEEIKVVPIQFGAPIVRFQAQLEDEYTVTRFPEAGDGRNEQVAERELVTDTPEEAFRKIANEEIAAGNAQD